MAICQCQGEERRVMTDVSDKWPQTLFVQIRFQSFSRHWMSGKIDRGEKSQLYRNHSILNNIQQQSNIVPSNSHLQEVIISYVQQNLNSAKHGDGEIQKIFTLRHLFCLKPKRKHQIIPGYKLLSSNICRITNINSDEMDSTFVEAFGIWFIFEGPSLTFSFIAFVHASSVTHSQVPKPDVVTTGLNQGQSHQTHFRLGILTMRNTPIVTSTFCTSLKASLSNIQHLFQHIQHGCHHRFSIRVREDFF